MKNLKTKISLSALALACLGAGAFSLQSNVNAKAEGEDYAALLNMQAGAAICLENDFSGIRWTTNVTANAGLANAQFGVLVAPTSMVGEDGLTLATAGAENLAFEAGAINATENDVTFYSVINYDNLGEDLQAASKLELMARAYVTVDGTTYYANMENVSTSRSARAVAMAAELSGYITNNYRKENATEADVAKATKAANYYGYAGGEEYYKDYTLSTGAVGTPVVDAQAPTEVVGFPLDAAFEGTVEEVLIGAEPVDLVLNEADRFRIQNTENAPIGEQYVTVFTSTNVYTFPVIVATKVLKTTDDLKMFRAKGLKNDGSTHKVTSGLANLAADQEFPGYYVLEDNIVATDYVHGSRLEDGTSFNNATWNGADKYTKEDGTPYGIGLTGTFNGMGYKIDSMTIGAQYEGFFGIVNGGKVKNVAFTNVKSNGIKKTEETNAETGEITYKYSAGGGKTVIAHYLIDATIENVYITTNTFNADDFENNPGFELKNSALVANYAIAGTMIKNCYFMYNKTAGSGIAAGAGGVVFSTVYTKGSDNDYAFENVYAISNEALRLKDSANKTKSVPHAIAVSIYDKDNGVKGKICFGENAYTVAEDGTMSSTVGYSFDTNTYDYVKVAGISCYRAERTLKGEKQTFDAMVASGCWKVSSDLPVWVK